jgi:acyl-CoA thioesterase
MTEHTVETWPDGSEVPTRFPAWGDQADLVRLMDVQPAGDGRFVAPPFGDTARNVVEGGQLMGDAIVAASKQIPDQRVTSISMIFTKAAAFDQPLDVEVDVLRRGRSFSTVEVKVTQAGSLRSVGLLLMDVGAPDLFTHTRPMPAVPGPEDSELFDFGVVGRELRVVEGAYDPDPDRVGPPQIYVWMRYRDAPATQAMHQALVAQAATHYTIASAMRPHPGFGEADAHRTLSTGVMKTTVSFHEDIDVTEWLLYENDAIHAGRGLAHGEGRIYTRDGRLVASFANEVMIRGFASDPAAVGLDYSRAM